MSQSLIQRFTNIGESLFIQRFANIGESVVIQRFANIGESLFIQRFANIGESDSIQHTYLINACLRFVCNAYWFYLPVKIKHANLNVTTSY